jgi:YggT family protein
LIILFLIQLIRFVSRLLVAIVILDAILSFVVDPFHPLRRALGRVVNPLLDPIRRVLPRVGMIDFSPLVLIILVQIIESLVTNLLLTFI